MIHPRLSFFPTNKFLIRLLVKKKINLFIKGFSANNSSFIKAEGFFFFFYKAADNPRIPDLTELYFIFPR